MEMTVWIAMSSISELAANYLWPICLSVLSYSLSSNEIKGIIGRAMVQVLSRRSLAAETWVRALVSVCWVWGRTKWH